MKTYLKPYIEVMTISHSEMLCSSQNRTGSSKKYNSGVSSNRTSYSGASGRRINFEQNKNTSYSRETDYYDSDMEGAPGYYGGD